MNDRPPEEGAAGPAVRKLMTSPLAVAAANFQITIPVFHSDEQIHQVDTLRPSASLQD